MNEKEKRDYELARYRLATFVSRVQPKGSAAEEDAKKYKGAVNQ